MYTLRAAESSDFEFLFRLKTRSYKAYVTELWGQWDRFEQRQRFAKAFAQDDVKVVEVGGQSVGTLSVDYEQDPVVLKNVELIETAQRRGLGTRIIHDVIGIARKMNRDVHLQVLRPNPAQELYRRLGFACVDESETHLQMRWTAKALTVLALERAMAPWNDEARRDAWIEALFRDAVREDQEVAFVQFAANRNNLGDSPRLLEVQCGTGTRLASLAAAGFQVRGCEDRPELAAAAARRAATLDDDASVFAGPIRGLVQDGSHDVTVLLDGAWATYITHEDRVEAGRAILQTLRPGGVLAIIGTNYPHAMLNYVQPMPRTEIRHDATISQIPADEFDFHEGTATRKDTIVVEVGGKEVAVFDRIRKSALIGWPQTRLALGQAGFSEFETYAQLDATTVGRTIGPDLVLTARRPPTA